VCRSLSGHRGRFAALCASSCIDRAGDRARARRTFFSRGPMKISLNLVHQQGQRKRQRQRQSPNRKQSRPSAGTFEATGAPVELLAQRVRWLRHQGSRLRGVGLACARKSVRHHLPDIRATANIGVSALSTEPSSSSASSFASLPTFSPMQRFHSSLLGSLSRGSHPVPPLAYSV